MITLIKDITALIKTSTLPLHALRHGYSVIDN